MDLNTQIDAINKKTMRISVSAYSAFEDLGLPEQRALARVLPYVLGGRILDIGIGGGRTVNALRAISRDYIGVDYVAEMVDVCRSKFPDARFEYADARSMPQFPDASCDLIMFSWAGICMVDHAGRIAILKEVRRLLKKGGFFIFSSYNINSADATARFYFPEISWTFNPIKMTWSLVNWSRSSVNSLINRLKLHRFEVRTDEYALINDRCHDYSTMLYYIGLENQIKQLRSANFGGDIAAFDGDGNEIVTDTTHGAITYAARA